MTSPDTSDNSGSFSSPSPWKKRLLRVALAIAGGAVILGSILVVRTLSLSSRQMEVDPAPPIALDEKKVVQNLSQAIRFKTISYRDDDTSRREGVEFTRFHKFLAKTFPLVHKKLERELVNKYSLLYTWKGRDRQEKPFLLMAHQDVVPLASNLDESWQQPGFSGTVAKGYIWGRGTLDDKASLMGILEAVERLLAEGFEPRRTIYLAFGHDEEIGGFEGARAMAALLKQRGVQLDFTLDEGLVVTEGILQDFDQPVALVGLGEKGRISLALTTQGEGGHSSMPPRQTAIGVVSQAVSRLEANPFPPRLIAPVQEMFTYLGPEMPFAKRLAMANLWLLSPVLKKQLEKKVTTNAILRTTTAVTMVSGGVKENVLPQRARAVVNFRILPGDTTESVKSYVEKIIDDDRVKVTILGKNQTNPVAISSSDTESFRTIQKTIHEVFPKALVAPGLMLAQTDSRHFRPLSDQVYRFMPLRFRSEDRKRVHGLNERISVANYLECIQFYYRLIQNCSESRS